MRRVSTCSSFRALAPGITGRLRCASSACVRIRARRRKVYWTERMVTAVIPREDNEAFAREVGRRLQGLRWEKEQTPLQIWCWASEQIGAVAGNAFAAGQEDGDSDIVG
eukprot:10225906-Alexandrium_andersonii.AAC.1